MVREPRAYAFPLATFHACVLTVGLAVVRVRTSASLDDTSPAGGAVLGFMLFALLWSASYVGTRWALSNISSHSFDTAIQRGLGGGAISGCAAVIGLLVPGTIGGALDNGPIYLVSGLIFAVITAPFAAIVGGAVGSVFAVLDWTILTIAGLGDGWHPEELEREAKDA